MSKVSSELNFIVDLWSNRKFILLLALIGFACGFTYSIYTKPIYQSELRVLPASPGAIEELNKFKPEANFRADPDFIFSKFHNFLLSYSNRNNFLSSEEFSNLIDEVFPDPATRFVMFNKAVLVMPPSRDGFLSVKIKLEDPDYAADVLNAFVNYSIYAFKDVLVSDSIAYINNAKDEVLYDIQSRQSSYEQDVLSELKQLEFARNIAYKLGLDKPTSSGSLNMYKDDLMVYEIRRLYGMGYLALDLEIEYLKNILKFKDQAPGVSSAKLELELLNSIKIDFDSIVPVYIDMPAIPDNDPVSPSLIKISIMSTFMGFFIGLLFVFFKPIFQYLPSLFSSRDT